MCVELEGCRAAQLLSAEKFDDRAPYFRAKFPTGRQVLRFTGREGEKMGYMKSTIALYVQRTEAKVSRQPQSRSASFR